MLIINSIRILDEGIYDTFITYVKYYHKELEITTERGPSYLSSHLKASLIDHKYCFRDIKVVGDNTTEDPAFCFFCKKENIERLVK